MFLQLLKNMKIIKNYLVRKKNYTLTSIYIFMKEYTNT